MTLLGPEFGLRRFPARRIRSGRFPAIGLHPDRVDSRQEPEAATPAPF